jgi:hypothetical protein
MNVASASFAPRDQQSLNGGNNLLDGSFEDMDEPTAALILQMQLADLEDVLSSGKGKNREGESTDQDVALSIYRQEVETRVSLLADRRMTESIARAVQTDGPLLMRSKSEARDHDLARQLQDNRGNPQDQNAKQENPLENSEEMDDELLMKLAMMYVVDMPEMEVGKSFLREYDDPGESTGPSTSKSTESAVNMRDGHRCVACQEDKKFLEVARVRCGHEYCQDCLIALFEASMTDESLFPPRCCRQRFDIGQLRVFLKPDVVTRFREKAVEFTASNRVYCSRSTCLAFIPPSKIDGDHARCSSCNQGTCAICNLAWHSDDCPQDTALQALLETATENGWQRCTSCRRLVELDTGCNHMT